MESQILVSQVAATVTAKDLEALFGAYGKVGEVDLSEDADPDGSFTALVSMKDLEAAEAALEALNGHKLADRQLELELLDEEDDEDWDDTEWDEDEDEDEDE